MCGVSGARHEMQTTLVAAGSLLLAASVLAFAEPGLASLGGPLSAAAVGVVAVGSLLFAGGA